MGTGNTEALKAEPRAWNTTLNTQTPDVKGGRESHAFIISEQFVCSNLFKNVRMQILFPCSGKYLGSATTCNFLI